MQLPAFSLCPVSPHAYSPEPRRSNCHGPAIGRAHPLRAILRAKLPPMKTRTLAKLIIVGGSLVIALCALEIGVRLKLQCDVDGNCKFRDTWLRPYHVPVRRSERILAEFTKSTTSGKVYDPELGWAQRPNVQDHNAAGFISTHPDVAGTPSPDCLRIAVFGGSYTEGTFDHGWWRVLEESLNSAGVKAEILNFGVAGYAMDQAYLRWKRDGVRYHPDIVMFGYSAGNCYDNLNMVRVVMDFETGLALTKPRFVLENGGLRQLNSPTVPVAEIPELLRHLPDWPLLQHEHFYLPSDYALRPWRLSRLLALTEAKIANARDPHWGAQFYQLGKEPAELSLAIIRQFAREAQAAGSIFCIAHVPHYSELNPLRATGKFQCQDLIDAVDRIAPMAHTEKALLNAAQGRPIEDFFVASHYNDQFQNVVGQELATFVQQHLAEWRPRPGDNGLRRRDQAPR